MFFYSSLGILIIAIGASFMRGRFFAIGHYFRGYFGRFKILLAPFNDRARFLKTLFFVSFFAAGLLLFLQSANQYYSWRSNELSKFLLPPYQPISYFLFYVGARFWAPYLASLVIGYLLFFTMRKLDKKYGGKFFYDEEFWMAIISISLVGHPGWLVYLIILLVVYLAMHLALLAIDYRSAGSEGEVRISFYYLWLPTAIFVIILTEFYLNGQGWWKLLVI